MEKKDFDQLAGRYLDGSATPVERQLVEEHFRIMEEMGEADIPEEEMTLHKTAVLQRIREQMEDVSVHRLPFYRSVWVRVAVAAVILFAVAGVVYLTFSRHSSIERPALANARLQDVAPGHNGAVLTLSDGRQVLLDSAGNGQLAQQGAVHILKRKGELVYQGAQGEPVFNTVSTARGRQWSVVLPDGSKVWLNCASSIRYSLNFSGARREVTITGEAYFEVAPDAARPFYVRTGELEVQVLGTHFNVNAYADEPEIRTSLLEGSVKVTTVKGESRTLRPGGQARLEHGQGQAITTAGNIDMEQVVAWKSGFFEFHDLDLTSIMRQVSRWYDIDITYEGRPGAETFGGRISRNVTLAAVLKGLEITGVRFRLENNRLIVQP